MYNMIFVMIFVFVDLLFVAEITRATEFEVKLMEIGATGTIPCDHVENDPEIRLVQWYKSRRTDMFENGDPSLASWADGETGNLPNYHMEDSTLSLVIEKATFKDEGLYMCSVVRGDLFTESNYYIHTVVYALPQMDPQITLDADLNRVHCTVEHVRPIILPVLNFDHSHASTEAYAVLNEDGTYSTSISCTLPLNKIVSQVDCSFFYLHYQGESSLDLRDVTTDSLIEDKTTTVSPMGTSVTSEGNGSRTIVTFKASLLLVMVILLMLFTISSLKWIRLKRKYHRDVQDSNGKESEGKRNQTSILIMA